MKRTPFTIAFASAVLLLISCGRRSDIPAPVTDESGTMVLVRGGSFKMGGRYGDRDETTVRKLAVSSFWLGRAEVTAAEFSAWQAASGASAVSEANPSLAKALPATNVEWREAIAYCNYLSEKAGLSKAYALGEDGVVTADWEAEGYRLPTETEFEWAASGGIYSRRYDYSGSSKAEEVAWYNGNADGPKPVKSRASNELGIYDLSGNVWEWCWDT